MFTFIQRLGLLAIPVLLTVGCEGGKPKPRLNCGESQYEEKGQCKGSTPTCQNDEVLVDGTCKAPNTCESGSYWDGQQCTASALSLEVMSQSACYLPNNGATRLILQFVARDEQGFAIDPMVDANNVPTALNSALTVNGESIDVESLIDQDSELLRANLAMTLLLDSSRSMLLHTPPAFTPMKTAAVSVLNNTQTTWSQNQAQFHWGVAWFNEYLYQPKPNNAGEVWTIDDVASIPEPVDRDFTGLLKAVDHMIGIHEQWYADGIAAAARDQHVLVVFSDGKDNHSWFDNADQTGEDNFQQMLFWDELGLAPVPTVSDIRDPASTVPNLRIHVMGMGSAVDENELKAIADLGQGQYFFGSNSDTLGDLFNQVQRELVTQQTLGVQTPLAAGDYTFTLTAQRISDGAQASHTWTQPAGSALPACADAP